MSLNAELRAQAEILQVPASNLHVNIDTEGRPELAAVIARLCDAVDELFDYIEAGEENGWDEEVVS